MIPATHTVTISFRDSLNPGNGKVVMLKAKNEGIVIARETIGEVMGNIAAYLRAKNIESLNFAKSYQNGDVELILPQNP
jgi:hypothetical protein